MEEKDIKTPLLESESKNKSFADEYELENKFVQFRDDNKKFWVILNVAVLFIAAGLIWGTYVILEDNTSDCGSIRGILWTVIALHTLNVMVSIINLCGLETKLFNCNMVCGFSVVQVGIFVAMQFIYFEAQAVRCMSLQPDIYFWLMFQIFIVWLAFAIVVCHFFRKYCQYEDDIDPNITPGKPGEQKEPQEEQFMGHDPSDVHDIETQLNNITTSIFTDHDFPATMQSIQGNYPDREGKMRQVRQTCDGWARASKFPNADRGSIPQIFKDGISPCDIKQGSIGNCYFVASLATLAEWPGRVEKLFATKKSNRKQLFGVDLYMNGIYQTIWLDNYFPVYNQMIARMIKPNGEKAGDPNAPIFAEAYGNELWVALAEKAWAKAHGGYLITAGGMCGETLRDLTGAPSYSHRFQNGRSMTHDLWEQIAEAERMQYAMTAGTPGTDRGQYDHVGIVPGHAYSLLCGREVTDKNGRSVRLIQMRNPWKQGEWKGAWADGSSDWTPELKEKLGQSFANDGLFWLTFEDMLQNFDVVDICKVDDKAQFSFKKVESESHAGFALVKFVVKKKSTGRCTFAISQRGWKTEVKEGNHQFDPNHYSRQIQSKIVKLINPKKGFEDSNVQVVRGGKDDYYLRDYYTEFESFEAGTYYYYADISWNGRARTKQFSVNCYGPMKVDFKEDESTKFDVNTVRRICR